jgi:hypothetical protein
MWTSIVGAIKSEYNSIRIWHRPDPYKMQMNQATPIQNSIYDDHRKYLPSGMPFGLGVHRDHNLRISRRLSFQINCVNLYGWPSRGGVIVLENATPPDFDFLELDNLDPPLRRNPDQSAEDEFCQKLLRLGATWWDSEKRRRFLSDLEYGCTGDLDTIRKDETLWPTRRECGWVRVAWPSEPAGALCVLACEKPVMGRTGKEKMRPRYHGVISLARTMDERCVVLQRLGGTMYACVEDYHSDLTFIKAWEQNHAGEKGPLFQEEFIDPRKYRGPAGAALNRFVEPGESA